MRIANMVSYSAIASLIAASVFSGNISYQTNTQPSNAQSEKVASLKTESETQEKDSSKTA
jgi:hypothetical protein